MRLIHKNKDSLIGGVFLSLLLGGILFFGQDYLRQAKAVTYTWTQTNWSSPRDPALQPSGVNMTSWSSYASSSPTGLDASASGFKLQQVLTTFTQTDHSTLITGFNYNTPTQTNTTVVGVGDSAMVTLLHDNTTFGELKQGPIGGANSALQGGVFTLNGKYFIVASQGRELGVYPVIDGGFGTYKPFIPQTPLPTDIAEIDITPNGKWILASSGGNSGYSVFAVRFDSETGEFLNQSWAPPTGTGFPQSLPASSIAVSRDGLWAVAGLRQAPYLYFFKLNQESVANPFVTGFAPSTAINLTTDVFDVAFDFDHSHVAIAKNTTQTPSGGIAIYNFNGSAALTSKNVPYVGGNSRSVVFAPPSTLTSRKFLVYQTNGGPGLGAVDYTTSPPTLHTIPKELESSEISSVEISSDGKEVYTHNSQTKAGSYRFNNDALSSFSPWGSYGNTAPRSTTMPFNTYGVALSPDGNFVVVYGASGQVVRFVRPPSSYANGIFISKPISFGAPQTISAMTHTASAFSGAGVSLRIRGGSSPTPDASWTSYVPESNIASLTAAGPVQYFQYEATIAAPPNTAQSSLASPALHDVSVSYSRYPASGYLISSKYKMTSLVSDRPAIREISWKEKIPSTASESVSFQLQSFSSFDSTVANNGWLGPDGTSGSSFSRDNSAYCSKGSADASGFVKVTCSVPVSHKINQDGYPYIQYRAELKSVQQNNTPTVSEVNIKYGINSAPTVSGVAISTVSSTGSHAINYSVGDTDNPSTVNVGVFYDIGLRLETDPGPAGNTINITVPSGGTLPGAYLPPDGMIAIDDEIIEYHNVKSTYVSNLTRGAAGSIFASIPSSHAVGSIIWVRANDSENATRFSRIPAATTCTSGTCIGSGVSLGSHQVVWTPKDDIPGNFYLTDAKIRIIANDQEVVKNIGSGLSSTFTLDTKPPKLSGSIDIQNAAILIPNQGYKVKGGSATLSLPSIDTNTDNISGNLMYFCGGSSCTAPPSGWLPTGGFAPAASYAWNINTTPQQIYVAVVDPAGNISTQQTAAVVSDTTPPPSTPSGSFKAQDISSSLGRPAVYLTWDPLVWSTQLDGFGRQDFKAYHIFRDNSSCSTPQDGFCEIASIGTGQTTSFADESVADKTTYNYRMQVEDDAGNVSYQVSDASIPKAQISVSLTGGPVIEPQIQNVRFVPQASYTDPITFYWDTVQKDSPTTPAAADSYVAYYKASVAPADPVVAFDNSPTQGSAQQKSVGVAQADGDCACHKVKLVGLEPGERYFFQLRSTLGSKTATHVVDTIGYSMLAAPPQLVPVISDITPTDRAVLTTPTKATITWNTKYPPTDALAGQPLNTDAFIEYGTSAALGTYTGNNESRPDHTVDIVGLQPNTTYYYQIHSEAGGTNGGEGVAPASGSYSFTTAQMAEDKVPPTITNEGVTQQFGTSVTVEWDTDEQASSITEYWETANAGVHALVEDNPGDNTQTHHITHVNNLTPETQYTCRVISLDASNNRSQSEEFSCDTGPAETLPDPVITNVHNDAPGPNNIVIYWDTDNVISNSVVFYSEDSGFAGALSRKSDALVNGHEVTLVGLTPGKEYFYKVKSSTAGDQTTAESSTCGSSPCKFQTPLAGEDAPQIVSGSISVTPQEHTAVITWRTSKAASSLIEYGKGTTIKNGVETPIYDGGVYGDNNISSIDGGKAHTVTLPANLIDGETYYFRVISYDSIRQLAQFPAGDPTSEDDPLDGIPSCSSDRYNCLNPSFDTVASNLTQEAETKDPLTISNVLPLAVTNVTAVVGWNTNRVADSCVIYGPSISLGSNAPDACDGRADIPELKELTRTHAVTLKDLQSNTKYYFKVVSRNSVATQRVEEDNAGDFFTFTTTKGTEEGSIINISACPGCVRPDESDVTPPVLSEVTVSDIGKNSAKVTWKTDEGASSIVQYGETSDYDGLAGNYTIVMDHEVTLKNLTGGTEYVFVAVSYDALGNRGESEEISFTTLGTKADKPTPEDEEEGDEKDQKDKADLNLDQKDSIEQILDILKGLSDEDASKVLQELGLQLVAPPKFVEGRPQVEVTQTSATISWATDKDADSRVAYVIGVDYNEKKQDPYALTVGDTDNFTKNHEVTIANLEPGTLYHYQIRSRERAGRTAYAPDRTFRTAPIKPDIAKVTVKDITEHTATFLWKTNVPTKTSVEYENQCAKDAQDCKKQKLTQGDSQLIKTHQFLLKDLISDTDYLVTIRSEDENGLQNISKPIKLRTGKDITPPELSQVRTKLSLSPGKEDAVQAVISWKTSEPADTQVFYAEGVKKDDLIKSGESSPLQADNTTNHVVVLNKLRPGTVYRFRAVSKDPAGNSNTPKEFKIITPRKEESVLELIIKNFEEAFGFLKGGQ